MKVRDEDMRYGSECFMPLVDRPDRSGLPDLASQGLDRCANRHATLQEPTVTANDFRRIALGLNDTVEGAHMGHPDFRVQNRIFASLNAEQTIGTVKLTPDAQQRFMAIDATVFVPASGAWGLQGWTAVHLVSADPEAAGEALTSAWQSMQAQGPSKKNTRATATASARSAKKGDAESRTARGTSAVSSGAGAVDAYIAACAPKVRTIMNTVRKIIRREAPSAGEKISYRMPAFEMNGMLIYYAPFKNHLGVFPPVTGDAPLSKALAKHRGEKGNLRFSFDEPMPYPLIRRVVQARLKEHLARLAAKRSGTAARTKGAVTRTVGAKK